LKVLHVVGNKIEISNGIGRLIPEMINMHNLLGKNINSSLLVLSDDYKNDHFPSFYYREVKCFESFLKRFDLVVFHGVYFFEYLRIYKKLIKYNIPYSIKPHSSLMKSALNKSKIKKKLANWLFFKKFIESANGVVFTNVDEEKNSVIWNNKSLIEPNGIKFDYLEPLKKTENMFPGKRFIYLSRIDFEHKGTDLLLDALSIIQERGNLDNIKLDIYGKGDGRQEAVVKKRILELGNHNIQFKGPAFGEKKINAFRESDIFILTSRYEGFPMAILEALFFGMPCIVTSGTNMSNILKNNNIGWLTDCTPKSIADAILQANVESCESISMKSKNGFQYVNNNHNWESVVKISESTYRNIVEGAK